MIDFNKIPDWWPLCPGYNCPQKETCLRHQAFQQTPKGVDRWPCILPTVLEEAACSYFQESVTMRMARGFTKLYQQLTSLDARHNIRLALTNHFGSKGTYYRYRDGERQLTPEQQEAVARIFRRYGFQGEITFDEYTEEPDFTYI